MVRYPLLILVSCAMLLGLFSCSEYKHIGIQVLNPSPVVVPRTFNSPLVVFSYYEGIQGEEESMARASFDSVAGSKSVETLVSALYQSPWFGSAALKSTRYHRKDISPYINPFPWDTVESICLPDTADLLISLEYVSVRPSLDSYSFYDDYDKLYVGSITNYIYAYWRIYDLNSRKIFGEYLYRDTIIWERSDYTPVALGQQLPTIFETAAYSGNLIGTNYANRIAPFWSDENRIVYVGNKELKNAEKLANGNSWLPAAQIWQNLYSKKNANPKNAAKSAFNLALANEMFGNFDVALEWLEISKALWFLPYQDTYLKIIKERMKQMHRLKDE